MATFDQTKQRLPGLLQQLVKLERRLEGGPPSTPLQAELTEFAGTELGGMVTDALFGERTSGKKLARGMLRDGAAKKSQELNKSIRNDVQRIAAQAEGLIEQRWTQVQARTIRKWGRRLSEVRTASAGRRTTTLLRHTQETIREILAYQPLTTTNGTKKRTRSPSSRSRSKRSTPTKKPAVILLCTANAAHPGHRLRLEEELRAIEDALQRSRRRDLYVPRICPAVTFTKVLHELDDHEPTFVHFSGYGDRSGSLILNGERNGELPVPPKRMADLLKALQKRPMLVTFATCYSSEMARAAARHAGFAIGFDGWLDDDSVPLFSATLYERLASRPEPETDVRRAFRFAKLACKTEGYGCIQTARIFTLKNTGNGTKQKHRT